MQTHIQAHTNTCTHSNKHIDTNMLPHTLTHSLSLSHTHTHTHTTTHTHHTQTPQHISWNDQKKSHNIGDPKPHTQMFLQLGHVSAQWKRGKGSPSAM